MIEAIITDRLKSDYILNIYEIFEVINECVLNYNWLITNIDCSYSFIEHFNQDKDYIWINGEDLSNFTQKNNIQFIWGVLTGFHKSVPLNKILEYPLPYADGNTNLWNELVSIQNPLAEIEIVAWDSTFAIIISKETEIINRLKEEYPQVRNLIDYNREINKSK